MSDTALSPVRQSRLPEGLRIFLRNRPAVIGLIVILILVLATLFAADLTPYRPLRGVGRPLLPPGGKFLLGTDNLGRDVMTTILYGMRVSLIVGSIAAVIAFVFGALMGALAGYCGGSVDNIIMRVTELFQVVPRIFLMIIAAALFGANIEVISIAIGLTSWPPTARLLRAEFLSRRESEYVLAARVIGASHMHIIFREILPNAIAPVIVVAALNVATAVLLEASLAFLGLSDPNTASLGRMLQESIQFLRFAWWMSIFPGVVIVLIAVSMNMVGEGMAEVLDPKARR